jgi:hypothetical protein
MNDHTTLSRRHLLGVAGIAAGGAALGLTLPAPARAAAPAPAPAGRANWSANGWPVVRRALTPLRIEGSDADVAVLPGGVAVVLLHVARRLHYEVMPLGPGLVTGHTTTPTGGPAHESNYLSGTAFAVRPGMFPPGSTGNLFPAQLVVVRDILAECEGVVRWGGDVSDHPAEGHFQIDVRPGDAALQRLAGKIRSWAGQPGAGAGTPPDPLASGRRSAARSLERRQRR